MPVIARAVVLLVAVVACRSGTTAGGPQPEAGGAGGAGGGVAHAPSPSRRKRGRDGVAGETGVDAGTAASVGERAAAKGLESARCRKNGCCATEIWSVGRDRKGRQLAVVALETNKGCLLPQEPRRSGSRRNAGGDDEHACGEYWLVDVGAPKRPGIAALGRQCDSDNWETHTAVDEKHMTFGYGGESVNVRAQTSDWTTIGLDPVRLVAVKHTSTSGGQDRSETWSSDDFAGVLGLGVFYCPGKAPADAGARSADSDVPDVAIEAVRIPRPSLPEGYLAEGWKTTALGRCAARVGGDRGFTVHGAKGTAADASMAMVFSSQGDLFVEVTDDRFVTGGKSWVKDDHLEIWAATPPDGNCIDGSAKSTVLQWGIRVTDGQVFPGLGPPTAMPKVEIARANDKTIRMRIRLDASSLPGPRFTVVYSDSDDGTHQERLIATSPLVFGKWWSMGEAPENEGPTCTVARGALNPTAPSLPNL